MEGTLRERIRTNIRQVGKELGVQIVSGVLSREHVHMFVEIPPHIAVSDFVRRSPRSNPCWLSMWEEARSRSSLPGKASVDHFHPGRRSRPGPALPKACPSMRACKVFGPIRTKMF